MTEANGTRGRGAGPALQRTTDPLSNHASRVHGEQKHPNLPSPELSPEMRKHRCFLRNISSLVWLSSQGSALGKVGGRNKNQGSALFRNVDLILLCHLESLELLLCQNALFRCVVITWPVQRDVM